VTCSECGWPAIRKLSLVHDTGTSSLAFDTTGTVGGLAGGQAAAGAFTARSSGRSRTALAAEAAPPRPASTFGPIVVALACLGLGWLCFPPAAVIAALGDTAAHPRILEHTLILSAGQFFGTALYLGAVVAALLARRRARYNDDVWRPAYALWKRTYLCERCGTTMIPLDSGPAQVRTLDHEASH